MKAQTSSFLVFLLMIWVIPVTPSTAAQVTITDTQSDVFKQSQLTTINLLSVAVPTPALDVLSIQIISDREYVTTLAGSPTNATANTFYEFWFQSSEGELQCSIWWSGVGWYAYYEYEGEDDTRDLVFDVSFENTTHKLTAYLIQSFDVTSLHTLENMSFYCAKAWRQSGSSYFVDFVPDALFAQPLSPVTIMLFALCGVSIAAYTFSRWWAKAKNVPTTPSRIVRAPKRI